MAIIGKDIDKAKALLESGEVVAIPTETVYGLAGNALRAETVTKIFSVKDRPFFDPLIVHVSGTRALEQFATTIPTVALKLAEAFWPGPLTLLLPRKENIPDLVTSGLPTAGFRCPNHPLTLELLNQLEFPLAAPSANPFGYVSPTTAAHVADQLGQRIPYILDGGSSAVGIESTIVGFDEEGVVVHRLGGLAIEAVAEVIGKVVVRNISTSNPVAPGQLISHYAPHARVILGPMDDLLNKYRDVRYGILSFEKEYQHPYQMILSPQGDLEEAARRLFSSLRAFDSMPVDVILAEEVPDVGLGRAINDRLRRAAS